MAASSARKFSADPVDETDGLLDVLGGPLENYAAGLLKVQTKEAELLPFRFNKIQAYIDALLEKQLDETKRVRALILKGRKVGVSTYVAGRFFRREHALTDQNALIMAHKADSTTTLFNVAKRFYNNLPMQLRPMVGLSNRETMTFPALRNTYTVTTAGGTGSARSQTIHLFHGSESAFWPNGDAHLGGALQTVADVPGTEIILESTANGVGGMFYNMWQQAERGEGAYQAIFVPFFWDDDCQRDHPIGWEPVDEERKYVELYGLNLKQLYWLHLKNIELGGSAGKIAWKFKQEYPANAQEAFQTTGGEGLIKSDLVTAARHAIHIVSTEMDARCLGVDTAQSLHGGDSTVFIDRCGRAAGQLVFEHMKTDKDAIIANRIFDLHATHRFHRIFIDVGFNGKDVYDRLAERGLGNILTGVAFGGEAYDKVTYKNKRAEIYDLTRKWFETPGGVRVPDDNTFHSHTCAIRRKPTSENRILMLDKAAIRKTYGFSPDDFDALATTFAEKVVSPEAVGARRSAHRQGRRRSFMSG